MSPTPLTAIDPDRPAEPIRLHVTLELAGKTATGFEVPEQALGALGAGKRPPVRVTLGEHTYRDRENVHLSAREPVPVGSKRLSS